MVLWIVKVSDKFFCYDFYIKRQTATRADEEKRGEII